MLSGLVPGRPGLRIAPLFLLWVVITGCSVKKFAINKVGDALSGSGTSFSSDDDPEFIQSAVPFSLKLIESLLLESPNHRGMLLAASSGFTQYAYAFIQQEADEAEDKDLDRATALRFRARRMYLRARNYGVRGLEVKHHGFDASLRKSPKETVHAAAKSEVALLYWTAASWGSAISLSKDQPDLIAEQPVVEALIDRAFELDPDFDHGAIHSFLINYEQSRPGAAAGAEDRSRKHFERAMQLSGGFQAAPLVSLAENVSQPKQNRKEFESLLNRALAVDVNAKPEYRLANLVMQRRARWLLSRAGQLFAE
jgi:predicted anti-sigma-YlaC factor YlaD